MPNQITGATLKWLALLTMVIDHIAAVALADAFPPELWWMRLLRLAGRLAYPLFAFLLVEGFIHTHSVSRYALRLAVFAVLSEIPFNLAFRVRFISWPGTNVFFTLLIGLAMLYALDRWKNRAAQVLTLLAAGLLATLLHTDYAAAGVLTVAILYLARDNRWAFPAAVAVLTLATGSWTELAALAVTPLIWGYHGQPGRKWGGRYFFYIFYPAHLLVLTILRQMIIPW